ncbi:hypothetical protein GE061_013867 [Apolygus lucorum]|uniref:Uncharacterized protein n=1 Tax=Apolygus lucorum TaxID=248454 RepID=A0A8S9XP78_APOLU|nr:hypothetical protein GE061_013867 [Apolygus lucorum]
MNALNSKLLENRGNPSERHKTDAESISHVVDFSGIITYSSEMMRFEISELRALIVAEIIETNLIGYRTWLSCFDWVYTGWDPKSIGFCPSNYGYDTLEDFLSGEVPEVQMIWDQSMKDHFLDLVVIPKRAKG